MLRLGIGGLVLISSRCFIAFLPPSHTRAWSGLPPTHTHTYAPALPPPAPPPPHTHIHTLLASPPPAPPPTHPAHGRAGLTSEYPPHPARACAGLTSRSPLSPSPPQLQASLRGHRDGRSKPGQADTSQPHGAHAAPGAMAIHRPLQPRHPDHAAPHTPGQGGQQRQHATQQHPRPTPGVVIVGPPPPRGSRRSGPPCPPSTAPPRAPVGPSL